MDTEVLDILLVVEAVSNETGVEQAVIFEAIEQALAAATRKRYSDMADIRVAIHREKGSFETFRRWQVVDDNFPEFDNRLHLYEDQAEEKNPALKLDDYYEEPVENFDLGNAEFRRIAAQAAKGVIVQKVRDAQREQVVAKFTGREGELFNGSVKKVTRDNIIIDLGNNAEGVLPREELVGREIYRVNDRIRAVLEQIDREGRGPQLLMSRASKNMLIRLFEIEVPEIGDRVIEVRSAARDPGVRAKIAVKTNDRRMDPVGACVGMRGARVQAVSNELDGERVDIVLWDDNPAQLVINALAPAEVESIVVDEDSRSMDVVVKQENLAQAIGRAGQNVRLASELTHWNINVMSEEEADSKQQEEAAQGIADFMQRLQVDEAVATRLVEEGFAGLEEVAYVPLEELAAVDGFDTEIAEQLRNRARDALLTQGPATAERTEPDETLLGMDNMDPATAKSLGTHGICSMQDLSEQAIDDLLEIPGIDEERAAKLIMAARAPLFADKEEAA
ncbi:MAG: transcription termination/antitermination protein NusA [Cellvibrionales bacterium]|nr:transcription termination/antitermination protein NusA [Cellvibrionales bacterium]